MVRKKYILIGISGFVVFIVLISTLLFISQNQQRITHQTVGINTVLPTPTPFSLAQTVLTLSYADQTHTKINILINTGTNNVHGALLFLTYPPQSFSSFSIIPGNFFDIPVVYVQNVDQTQRQIIYGLGTPPGKKGKQGNAILATITYTKASNSAEFIPQLLPKTTVTADGISQSVLETINGL